MRGRTLGCAYYDGHLAKLYVMQDMVECSSLETIELIKVQIRPTLILSSSRLDDVVMDALRFSETGEETKVEVLSGNDFSYSTAKSKLISVSTHMANTRGNSTTSRSLDCMSAQWHSSEMHDSSQRDAQIYLSNLIDIQSTESVASAGAIISFLFRQGPPQRSSGNGHSLMIFSIESFVMYVLTRNKTFDLLNNCPVGKIIGVVTKIYLVLYRTLLTAFMHSSLQIFEDETHPSMHTSIRGRKEGLSLFGILDQTKTPQGRYLLKQWLLRPSTDLAVLYARHQTVECFTRTENQPTIGQLIDSLSHIKNIPRVLQALPRKATIAEWQAILQFVYYCLKIYHVSREIFVGEAPIISHILQYFDVKGLMDIGANINDVVDFDESIIEGRCVVKHNVDEELDHMRQTYHGLDSFLSEIAKEISMTIPSDFASVINVIYFPQLGYLITVPRNPNWKNEQDFSLAGLSYQFCTDSTVYYKNNSMRDREIDIMHGLQERVLEHRHFLVTCSDLCAELDVLVAMGQVARLRNYRRPKMTEQNILRIVNGRHPLQELVVSSFVANDTALGDNAERHADADGDAQGLGSTEATADGGQSQFRRHETRVENDIIILSGANSSGKSVYLKQVALITFMAHIGSFVPAESAVVGLTDKILTRLQTRETVSSIQSAFMTDLQQVTLALRMATRRSLIALDEFGKGTTATDGAGLFCGLIEHFANIPSEDRPKVLATTHFHELFENRLLDLTLPISLYTMEVYQERNGLEATFLFHVIRGKTPASLGPACAAMAGMPSEIVQRGIELSNLFRRYEVVIPRLTRQEQKVHKLYEKLIRGLVRLDLDRVDIESDQQPPIRGPPSTQTEDSISQGALAAAGEKRLQPAMSSCSSAFSELFEWFAEDAKRREVELGYDLDENAAADKKARPADYRGTEAVRELESMEGNASLTSRATRKETQRKRLAFSVIEELFECALDVDFVERFGDEGDSEEGEAKEKEGPEHPDKECLTSVDMEGYEDLQELEIIDLTNDAT
ncbi:unnamed protein product [Mortierella alpina]